MNRDPALWIALHCRERFQNRTQLPKGSLLCFETHPMSYLCQMSNTLTEVLLTSPPHTLRIVFKWHKMGNYLHLKVEWCEPFPLIGGLSKFFPTGKQRTGTVKFYFLSTFVNSENLSINAIQNISVNKFQKFNFVTFFSVQIQILFLF